MDVLLLIDKLDDLVHSAKQVRLRDQVRVHSEEVRPAGSDARDDPDDVKQARWIVEESRELLAAARREAQRIVAGADERHTRLVSEHELTRRAELEAEEIIDGARAREREIRLGAEAFAEEIRSTLEVNLSRFNAAIGRGRERL